MYVIGFNGPPESGKDTLAELVAKRIEDRHNIPVKFESLSLPLRAIAYQVVSYKGEFDGHDYESFKRTSFNMWNCFRTGRELMIDVSESYLKRLYGTEIMAHMLIRRNIGFAGILLIRDCGFQCEVDPLLAAYGTRNVYLARITRPDKDFSNDSREWVNHHDSGCSTTVDNSGTLEDLDTEAGRIYGRLVNQMGWTF